MLPYTYTCPTVDDIGACIVFSQHPMALALMFFLPIGRQSAD
jgi:hypothetical protein